MSTLLIILLCIIFSAPAVVISAAFWALVIGAMIFLTPAPKYKTFDE